MTEQLNSEGVTTVGTRESENGLKDSCRCVSFRNSAEGPSRDVVERISKEVETMRRVLISGLLTVVLAGLFLPNVLLAQEKEVEVPEMKPKGLQAQEPNPVVLMKTSMGDMKIELLAKEAPVTVENFLTYVNEGFYNGTIFHRVIKDFMVQGGGFDKDMKKKATHDPIKNEAANGLSNEVGTLAMARTSDINSATSQFFINVKHNKYLDHRGNEPSQYGYAVFAKVIEGMDVAMEISKVKTGAKGPFAKDAPLTPVVIESVTLVSESETAAEEATEEASKMEEAPMTEEEPASEMEGY
jgi:peptidyl-prolyl cis-trans isomerase B (cyclophilin B)